MTGRVQYMLIIGAMLILSQLSLTVNNSVLGMQDISYENEAVLAGTSLAQSTLRLICSKAFDQKVIGKKITSPDSLTTTLGPEAGETYATYNDVDDYNGVVRTDTTGRLGAFTVRVNVNYTTKALLGGVSASKTFMKAVTVTVSGNPYLKNTSNIVMRSIVAY
jgi:hypothetical protein